MLHYRTITAADDAALAKIIRTNLEQLHLDVPGTAYFDPELDHMSQYYAKAPEKRAYFILTTAMRLYEKLGFQEIEKPSTVLHGTMDHFYRKRVSR